MTSRNRGRPPADAPCGMTDSARRRYAATSNVDGLCSVVSAPLTTVRELIGCLLLWEDRVVLVVAPTKAVQPVAVLFCPCCEVSQVLCTATTSSRVVASASRTAADKEGPNLRRSDSASAAVISRSTRAHGSVRA